MLGYPEHSHKFCKMNFFFLQRQTQQSLGDLETDGAADLLEAGGGRALTGLNK